MKTTANIPMAPLKKKSLLGNAGFTLSELLIAMVVSGIIVSGTVMIFQTMVRSHNTQVKLTAMQQNLRAAMFYLERNIRMAGFDPTDEAGAEFTSIKTNRIAFTSDIDENGTIDSNWDERLEFRLNADRLVRIMPTTNAEWLVADNIEALNFVYLDKDGDPTTIPSSVRSVQVTIVGRIGPQAGYTNPYVDRTVYTNRDGAVLLPAQNDNIRRMALTSTVYSRNLKW
jgi:type IV pilus assembly protein PilW